MRVSIWRQWASNHSSYFTVVGVFDSPAAAQNAAAVIRKLFEDIEEWFNQPENTAANNERKGTDHQYAPVSGPEIEIATRYDINWYKTSIGWHYPGYSGGIVTDHILFIEPGQTWTGGGPLAALLTALGGTGMVDGDFSDAHTDPDSRKVNIMVRCVAPDEETADGIVNHVERHAERVRDFWQNPENSDRPTPPWVAFVIDGFSSAFSSATQAPKITRHGVQLRCTEFSFVSNLGYVIPPIVAWLKSRGCTEFGYEISETIVDPEDL